jgi:hypothetical protein
MIIDYYAKPKALTEVLVDVDYLFWCFMYPS